MKKHDVIMGECKVDGKFIGYWIKPRTARQAAEDKWTIAAIRKQFKEMLKSSEKSCRIEVKK